MKIPQTIEVSVAAMQENEHNPRHITDGNFDLLVKSILTLPKMMYLRPTVADDANRPLGGNMRTRAQKYIASLNIDQIKTLLESTVKYKRLPDDRRRELVAFWDEWLMRPVVPVLYASVLDPDEVQEFIIKDNTAYGEWDIDILANEFDTEELLDIDPELLPQSARDALAAANGEDLNPDEPDATEDNYDVDTEVERRVTRGDIWQCGRHRVMCGDATDKSDVAKLMNGKFANMTFTDPPYGYEYQSNWRHSKFDVIKNDDCFLDFMPNIKEWCRGFVFICTTWKVLAEWLPIFNSHFGLSNMVIWDKGGGGIGDLAHTFSTDYELILCANNGEKIRGKRIGSVWSIAKDGTNTYKHPTQKPVGLAACAIKHTTDIDGIILDLFGGSGSTLIACEQLNRQCYTMELDAQYCDKIITRWEQLTGGGAVKL